MYVKKFDNDGKLLNPITKDNPFINLNKKVKTPKIRKKNKLIITKLWLTFYKTKVFLQRTPDGKIIEHSQLV